MVLDVGETVAGYVSYGRCRDRSLPADGEIDELYLAPEYQGLGFGTRLFKAVRNDLDDRGIKRIAVWCARRQRARPRLLRAASAASPSPRRSSASPASRLAKIAYLFR